MVDCERCGQRGVPLPCPGCGWLGEPVDTPIRPARRGLPLFFAGGATILAGALLTLPAWSALARALVLMAAGLPLQAALWFGAAGAIVLAGLGLLTLGRRLLRRSTA